METPQQPDNLNSPPPQQPRHRWKGAPLNPTEPHGAPLLTVPRADNEEEHVHQHRDPQSHGAHQHQLLPGAALCHWGGGVSDHRPPVRAEPAATGFHRRVVSSRWRCSCPRRCRTWGVGRALLARRGDGGVQGLVEVLLCGAQVTAGWGGGSGDGVCGRSPPPSATMVAGELGWEIAPVSLPWGPPIEHQRWGIPPPSGVSDLPRDRPWAPGVEMGPLRCHCLPWGPLPWTRGVGESPLGITNRPRDPPQTPGTEMGIPVSATAHPGDMPQGPGMEMRVPFGATIYPWDLSRGLGVLF